MLLFIKHSVKLKFGPNLLIVNFKEREPHFHSILELRIPFNSKKWRVPIETHPIVS
jgi:hypothetical protein